MDRQNRWDMSCPDSQSEPLRYWGAFIKETIKTREMRKDS